MTFFIVDKILLQLRRVFHESSYWGIKMSNKLTLEQVEQLAEQLPLQEQLKLINRLSGRLTETIPLIDKVSKKERSREIAAILRECDQASEAFTRKTDSAETIRRMRDERYHKIC
jgi:hypothetical protein